MIPKILHFIWVGDESKRPDNCIQTWRDLNPSWEIRIWGNNELKGNHWINRRHMASMYGRELNGVADLMRWEILLAHGGVALDADSVCLRSLDDNLLDGEAAACWENEVARPGLIATVFLAFLQGNHLIDQIVSEIFLEETVTNLPAWVTVGPKRLTDAYRKYRYFALRIYPSYYFMPRHFSGIEYEGDGPVYATQAWGSTQSAYEQLHSLKIGPKSGNSKISPGDLFGGLPSADAKKRSLIEVGLRAPLVIARKFRRKLRIS
jgi:mannosyltransferase OCH1-like enzyme